MITNCNLKSTNYRIYTEFKQIIPTSINLEKFLSTIQKISELAFSVLSDTLILPGIGLLVLWMLLRPSFNPLFLKKDKVPILLLHGSGFNESQWIWGRFFLRNKNYGSIFSVSYEKGLVTNDPKQGIDDCAMGKVRDKILEIKKLTGQNELVLIGHSMGGLVASYYAEHLAKEDHCNIRHVISIASPWQGTPVIKQLLTKKCHEKRYVQMSPNSPFREKLIANALCSEQTGQRTYYTIGSKADLLVPFPHSSLAQDLPHQHTFSSLGHFGIVVFPHVWNKVRIWLDQIYEPTST